MGDRPKKALQPARIRELEQGLVDSYRISRRRACRLTERWPSTMRYESVKDLPEGLRLRMKDLASALVQYGYRRLHVLLQCEGWEINHKRVYWI